MEQVLAQAKLADWMRSFSDFDLPKSSPKQTYEWMEERVVPCWMFMEYSDTFFHGDDEQYFDEYTVDHHQKPRTLMENSFFVVILWLYSLYIILIYMTFIYFVKRRHYSE